ncbi:DUF6285 domain-containing protein [Halioglobus maricola]|uniref:DUF6285 domain-containing protein n=1 Tax=Halioglobus maricola TaxID=2601894 RepID=UPI001478B478|nr:DUF6285 domain-containing protein [Halioglobus maricola]
MYNHLIHKAGYRIKDGTTAAATLIQHVKAPDRLEFGDLEQLRWQLVHALRADLPLGTPGLDEHVRETMLGQLTIDHPLYLRLLTSGSP